MALGGGRRHRDRTDNRERLAETVDQIVNALRDRRFDPTFDPGAWVKTDAQA
jgi:hypothetical protein